MGIHTLHDFSYRSYSHSSFSDQNQFHKLGETVHAPREKVSFNNASMIIDSQSTFCQRAHWDGVGDTCLGHWWGEGNMWCLLPVRIDKNHTGLSPHGIPVIYGFVFRSDQDCHQVFQSQDQWLGPTFPMDLVYIHVYLGLSIWVEVPQALWVVHYALAM